MNSVKIQEEKSTICKNLHILAQVSYFCWFSYGHLTD
jgi:hypothetical protein